MKKPYFVRAFLAIFLFTTLLTVSCKKLAKVGEAIDGAIGEMLGVRAITEDLDRASSNYNEIENLIINGKSVGSTPVNLQLSASVPYSFSKKRYSLSNLMWTITTTPYSGTVPNSMFTYKNTANEFKVTVQNNTPKVFINNVAAGSPIPNNSTGSGTSPGNSSVLIDKVIEGNAYDLKSFSFTVPANVKSMTVKTTESTSINQNSADLFVRKGSAPIVAGPKPPTYLPKYTWTADCYGIKPNREDEICTFTSPESGIWYVSLYGYNFYFNSRVIITITK